MQAGKARDLVVDIDIGGTFTDAIVSHPNQALAIVNNAVQTLGRAILDHLTTAHVPLADASLAATGGGSGCIGALVAGFLGIRGDVRIQARWGFRSLRHQRHGYRAPLRFQTGSAKLLGLKPVDSELPPFDAVARLHPPVLPISGKKQSRQSK